MIEFNGTQYDVPESMLSAAVAYIGAVIPNATKETRDAEIAKMLGKGTKLAKADAKGAHEKTLTERAAQIAKDGDFLAYAEETARAYRKAIDESQSFADLLGALPVPKRNGDGYKVTIPAPKFDAAKFVALVGELDPVKFLLNEDAPDDSTNIADFHAYVELDLPELDELYAGFRENRQAATDAALAYLKDVSDYRCSVSETGELILTDASAHAPGTPRAGGTRISSDTIHAGVWNGQEFKGTSADVVKALKAAGAKVPATIEHNPSHLWTNKCPKSLGFTVKA